MMVPQTTAAVDYKFGSAGRGVSFDESEPTNIILVFPSQPQGQCFHQFRARQRRTTPLRRRPMRWS